MSFVARGIFTQKYQTFNLNSNLEIHVSGIPFPLHMDGQIILNYREAKKIIYCIKKQFENFTFLKCSPLPCFKGFENDAPI